MFILTPLMPTDLLITALWRRALMTLARPNHYRYSAQHLSPRNFFCHPIHSNRMSLPWFSHFLFMVALFLANMNFRIFDQVCSSFFKDKPVFLNNKIHGEIRKFRLICVLNRADNSTEWKNYCEIRDR